MKDFKKIISCIAETADPLLPWQDLLKHPDCPIRSRMSLDRYRKRGLIETVEINGRHYLRVHQTLRRLGITPPEQKE